MNFQDIQMTQSYGLRVSSYSRTSQQQAAEPKKNQMRYKCYECGGDSIKSHKCRCCHGLKQVSDNNVMVGLMMQVMCRKLGKDVPTLRNFPKLQFSSQNRLGSKSAKTKFDPQLAGKNKGNDYDRNRRVEPYSEGNSANQSNSLDSSLDSLDSSQNSRSNIRNKEKAQKNKGTRYIKLYQNQPNFRQQISEIKQESYATEDYSVSCDKCHKDSDLSGDFMQCKICKHFYICMKCYEERVEEIRRGSNLLGEKQVELPGMKREKSAITQPTSATKQGSTISLRVEKLDIKNKSCQFVDEPRNEQVNYDNYYQIHEHPLSRYCHPHDTDDFKPSDQVEDYVDERNYQSYDDEEQFSTYGGVTKSKKQREQIRGSPSYKNLFKVYDSHNHECPQSPKRSPPYLDIQVIREQKQSPSPSQKSEVWPVRQSESQFDNNISMTISNNFESPDSEKVVNSKNGRNLGSGNNSSSDRGSPINMNLNNSSNLFMNQKLPNNRQGSKLENDGKINLFENNRFENNRKSLRKINSKNELINHIKINRDSSEWSQYSGLYQNQSVNTQNMLHNIQFNQSNIEIMENQNQSESRVIQSPDEDNEDDAKSIQSGKQSPLAHQESDQLRREKQKNYTQKKANKFTSIRANGDDNKSPEQKGAEKNSQHLQSSPQVTLPQNLLTNFLSQSNGLQQQLGNESIEIYPLISLPYPKKQSQSLLKQDFKECSKCSKQILNRSMYMKCQTCQKTNKRSYELCDGCFAMREVIAEHNENGDGAKHVFRAYLYRKSGGMSIDLMDEQEDANNQKSLQPENISRLNLISSANSVSIEPLQSSEKKVAETLRQVNNNMDDSPLQDQESQEYHYAEQEKDEKSEIERQRKYNQQYLKRREKQCQQNEKIKKLYENLVLNSLFLSNRQSLEKERERLSASSNAISEPYRYSQNVGTDGKWLMEPLELQRHTSVTCIGGERESANNKLKQSVIDNQVSNLETRKIGVPESQTLNLPQSSVNIITTSNTLISNDKAPTNQLVISNKNQKNSTSIKLPQMFNISNNCSIEENTKFLLPEKQSPSRQSIVSYKSGSPDKSQMSSRIRVDCGDSESEFQHHEVCKVEDDQKFHKPHPNQHDVMLSKSIRMEEKNNILGNSYAISEPQQSDPTEEDYKLEDNKKKRNFASSSYDYRIITHQIMEEHSEENRPRSITVDKDDRGKNNQVDTKDRKKSNKSLSKSGSEKDSKKITKNYEQRIMMDFLNKIDKSEKLSKSDNQEENSKQKKQRVHFNYQQDEEMPYQQFLNEQPTSNNVQEEEIVEYFVFKDYQCDQCGQTPLNVRYHCKQCDDFDLCATCYRYLEGHLHPKSDFDKINKRKELKLQEQDRAKQQEQRNNLLRAILDKYAPRKSKNDSLRNSLPGENKATSDHWRMGHSLNSSIQQNTKLPTKSLFMEKNNHL